MATKVVNRRTSDTGTNIFAILSLVFGIVFFIPFAPILAIIFGFVGLSQIRKSGQEGRGMAIAGIVLGFVWIIITILIILFVLIFLSTLFASIMPVAANSFGS